MIILLTYQRDYNVIHFDDKKAKEYGFKARIAHGMIAGSLISKVIATKLPGDGSIYLNQVLNFKAPIYVGDEIKVEVKVFKIKLAKRIVELETNVYSKGESGSCRISNNQNVTK